MQWLYSHPRRVLGVFVAEDALFLIELERTEESGRFRVRQAREEKWRTKSALYEEAASLSENLMRLCMTYGFSDKISMCLPRELFFVYEREFPPMERAELDAAARWDIETNVPFAEGTYWPGFGRAGDQIELAAIPSEHGRELVEAMTEAGLGLEGFAMEPLKFTYRREGQRLVWRDAVVELSAAAARTEFSYGSSMALYAALRVFYPFVGIEFLPEGEKAERARQWQMAGNALLACTLLVVSFLFARNCWLLSSADAQIDSLRQAFVLETRERETMENLAEEIEEIAGVEGTLRKLSAERRSWYAVFSELGAATVDGVYLTEFDMQEDGAMLCGGRAMDYARLVAYLERLEQDGSMLREKPLLKESTADERGEIRFKLRLRFGGGRA